MNPVQNNNILKNEPLSLPIETLKRSNTVEKKKSNLKTPIIFPYKMEENEENKENVITNITSEKIIQNLRKEALLNRGSNGQNKFRIVLSKNKKLKQQRNSRTFDNLIENFELKGNNCLPSKN